MEIFEERSDDFKTTQKEDFPKSSIKTENQIKNKTINLKGVQIMKKLLLFTLALVGASIANAATISVGSGQTYTTINDATVTDAGDNGIINLTSDINVSAVVAVNNSVTIDLNGHTIWGTSGTGRLFKVGGKNKTVTFQSTGSMGQIFATGTSITSCIRSEGGSGTTLMVDNIRFGMNKQATTSGYPCVGINVGTATIKNCEFITTDGKYIDAQHTNCVFHGAGVYVSSTDGKSYVENCKMAFEGTYNSVGGCVVAANKAVVEVDEKCEFTCASVPCIFIYSSGGTITIKGGKYEGKGTTGYRGVIYLDYDNYTYKRNTVDGNVIVNDGIFNGLLVYREGTYNLLTINKGVFTTNSIANGSSDLGMTGADGMYFKDYKAYTGSSISDVKPYTDYAAAVAANEPSINILEGQTISETTTIANRTITAKGEFDAFTVTGALTVDGTTTITNYTGKNAINVNGGSLTVPSTGTNVTIGTLAKTSGTISLAAGTYSQDVKDYVAEGYESVQLSETSWQVQAEPTEYNRSVTSGNWGTICLAKATSAVAGAEFYSIVKKGNDGTTDYIELVQHEGQLEAGMPYIFKATAATITCTYTGKATTAQNANGLYGTLANVTSGLSGKYLIANNAICPASNDATLSANRAYIDLTQVPTTGTAPGRKVYLSTSGVNTATGFDFVEIEAAASEKVIINGKLYIRRGAQLFDAQGALVK